MLSLGSFRRSLLNSKKVLLNDIPIYQRAHVFVSLIELVFFGIPAVDIPPLEESYVPLDLALPMKLLKKLASHFLKLFIRVHIVEFFNFSFFEDRGLDMIGDSMRVVLPNVMNMFGPELF